MRASAASVLAMAALATWPAALAGRGVAQARAAATAGDVPVESAPLVIAAAPAPASLAIPASWQAMPQVRDAVIAGLGVPGISGLNAGAWGDPARACYAIYLAASAPGVQLAQVEAGLRKAFAAPSRPAAAAAEAPRKMLERGAAAVGVEVSFEVPAGGEAAPAARGRVRALVRDTGKLTRLTAVACVWGDRYPESCQHACEPVLAHLEAP